MKTGPLDSQGEKCAAKDQEQDRFVISAGRILRIQDPGEGQHHKGEQGRGGQRNGFGHPPCGHPHHQPGDEPSLARHPCGSGE